MSGKMRVYGAGGAGINIASKFANRAEQPGYATVHPVYLDTSRSNLKPEMATDDCYILQNVDGSGKVRRENASEIANVVKQVLLQYKPMDMNVVVFSASGGSGSVWAPLLIGELLERDQPVVAVVIGSDESAITCKNTMNTLKSLDSISKQKGKPIVMYYDHNTRGIRRSEIDTSVVSAIACLSILASRQNEELDTQDVANLLQFNRVSDVKPQLALLEIYQAIDKVDAVLSPVAIASLYSNPDEPTISSVPDYHCCGYATAVTESAKNLHFVITVDDVPNIARGIQKTMDSMDEVRQSRVTNVSLVTDEDEVSANGLVL